MGLRAWVSVLGMDALIAEGAKRSATLAAVRAGARVMVRGLKLAAPKRSGSLKAAQGVKASKGRKGKTTSFAVAGARRKVVRQFRGKRVVPGNYHHLADRGARPHPIPTKGGGVVNHPGAKPSNFVARAVATFLPLACVVARKVLGEKTRTAFGKAARKFVGRKVGV